MKTSKIIAASALATVMSASAAYADLSISGGMGGHFYTGDTASSSGRSWNTESVNVSYSDTLDNGMGISVSANVGQTAQSNGGATLGTNYTMTLSSDLGSLSWGDQLAGAADKVDGIVQMSFYECCTWGSALPDGMTTGYHDGDVYQENNGFLYQSPSVSGFTIYASHLMMAGNGAVAEDSSSAGIKGSLGPVSVAAGLTRLGDTAVSGDGRDSSFVGVSVPLGAVSVSAGMFDGGSTTTDTNAVVVNFPVGDLSGIVGYADNDASGATYDASGYTMGLKKSSGPLTFGVQYDKSDTAAGSAGEVEVWKLFYILYF